MYSAPPDDALTSFGYTGPIRTLGSGYLNRRWQLNKGRRRRNNYAPPEEGRQREKFNVMPIFSRDSDRLRLNE